MRLRICAGRYLALGYCVLTLSILGVPLGDAAAQDVQPGLDLFTTDQTTTEFDFTFQQIPSDFFGPGSDPFDGIVPCEGLPLFQNPFCPPSPSPCPYDNLDHIDTIVERAGTASLPSPGSSDLIPIEIVELSLVSVNPITVTYNGGQNPEQWDLHVCPSENQQTGSMQINKTHANGGTFDATLPVVPRFIFTRIPDGEERVLDGASSGFTDTLEILGVPWEYANPDPLSCRSNFCAPDPFTATGSLLTQTLLPTCVSASGVPAMMWPALIGLAAILASVCAYFLRRVTYRDAGKV